MESSDIKIFVISSLFFFFFAALWNFFMLTGTLYLFKRKEILYTKKFYYYIIYGALVLLFIDRGFNYLTTNFEPLKNIWQNGSNFLHLGFVIGLIFVFTLAHYFLLTLVLDFDDKTISAALVMGIFNAPWYLISPLTFFIPLGFLIIAYLVGRKPKVQ